MASDQQDQDRTEEATPFKLREAKKRGQVNKSMEINSLLILSIALGMIYLIGEKMVNGQAQLSRNLLSQANNYLFDATHIVSLFDAVVNQVLHIFWPFFVAIIVIGILSTMTQTGPVFSFHPLKPDVQRLNPVSGFKRLFSAKLLFESVKTIVKLALFATIIYLFVVSSIPKWLGLLDTSPDVYAYFFVDNSKTLIARLLLVLLIIAIMDLFFTRWDFAKKMRMSRREVKDEVKRRDGDPHVKAKIREQQREAAKRAGSLARVPEADVLITNPTHLSVALKYERGVMQAPEVIAKGAGDLALKMRQVASMHRVPIVENKPLARHLFKKVDIEQAITEDVYPVVAKILVWAFALKNKKPK